MKDSEWAEKCSELTLHKVLQVARRRDQQGEQYARMLVCIGECAEGIRSADRRTANEGGFRSETGRK